MGCAALAVEKKRRADKTTYYEVEDSDSPGQKIRLTFAEVMGRGYARGKISMRRQQIKMLNEGNGTMGVWLGKQYLGQKDQQFLQANITDERSVIRSPEVAETPTDWAATHKPH